MSSQLSESDFCHEIANWGLYMAEGVLELAAVAVAKITIWPPLQYYLIEKWDWPSRSKGNKKPPHDEEGARVQSSSDEAGGPAAGVHCTRCFCEHESAPIGFKKPMIPRPSSTSEFNHDETVSEEFSVILDRKEVAVLVKVNQKIKKKKRDLAGSHSSIGPSIDE
jgi:hypothetical protein